MFSFCDIPSGHLYVAQPAATEIRQMKKHHTRFATQNLYTLDVLFLSIWNYCA